MGGDAQLFAPLERPPTALSLTVRKLIGRVLDGSIRVPTFQRPLRWQSRDVLRLLDSVLKGYPIGSLLFWKQSFPAVEDLQLGRARCRSPAHGEGWFIVDGQQRTVALAATLLDLDQQGDPRWTVRFDPRHSLFLSGPPPPEEEGIHVPLSALGDLRRLGKWLRECRLEEALQAHVEDVQQRLLDYEIPAYLVENEAPETLRGIFARLNSTGVRMRADEVFQALLGPRGGPARPPGTRDLEALQTLCDVDGFGTPPRAEILKSLLAMSDVDPVARLEELGEQALSRLVPEAEAADALSRTVAFLQAPPDGPRPGAGIPAYALLPYPVVFVLLARWFHRFPDEDPLLHRELARWVWRGILTASHQRAAVSALRKQARLIQGNAIHALRHLHGAVADIGDPVWNLGVFHSAHAASRVEILTLLAREPRGPTGPVSFRELLSAGQRIAREIIPSRDFGSLSVEASELARTAANRALLDARHTGLRAELRRWSWDRHREALESHLIDEQGFALLATAPSDFLVRRGALLQAEVEAFLRKRAGVGEPRLYPVEAYFSPQTEAPEARAATTS